MYKNATSVKHVNGHIFTPKPIQCGVRQGYPLSMTLFVICLKPLLYYLDVSQQGNRAYGTERKTTVIAYADDVSILVTSQENVRKVRIFVPCYVKANGATLKFAKSSALEVATWDTACDIMG